MNLRVRFWRSFGEIPRGFLTCCRGKTEDREKKKDRGNYFDLFPEIDRDYDKEIDKGIEMDFDSFFG